MIEYLTQTIAVEVPMWIIWMYVLIKGAILFSKLRGT